jgi:hypothetical protein
MGKRRTGPIEDGNQGLCLTKSSIDRAKAAWVLQVGFFGLSSFTLSPYQTISQYSFLFHFDLYLLHINYCIYAPSFSSCKSYFILCLTDFDGVLELDVAKTIE